LDALTVANISITVTTWSHLYRAVFRDIPMPTALE